MEISDVIVLFYVEHITEQFIEHMFNTPDVTKLFILFEIFGRLIIEVYCITDILSLNRKTIIFLYQNQDK